MGIVLEESTAGSVVRLDGAIDIALAAELKAALVQTLRAGRAVAVSLEAVTYLDVTAVQLLWAAERRARQTGADFGVAGGIPDGLAAALAEAGFAQLPALTEAE
jgi:anti-anti-sigma factor